MGDVLRFDTVQRRATRFFSGIGVALIWAGRFLLWPEAALQIHNKELGQTEEIDAQGRVVFGALLWLGLIAWAMTATGLVGPESSQGCP